MLRKTKTIEYSIFLSIPGSKFPNCFVFFISGSENSLSMERKENYFFSMVHKKNHFQNFQIVSTPESVCTIFFIRPRVVFCEDKIRDIFKPNSVLSDIFWSLRVKSRFFKFFSGEKFHHCGFKIKSRPMTQLSDILWSLRIQSQHFFIYFFFWRQIPYLCLKNGM